MIETKSFVDSDDDMLQFRRDETTTVYRRYSEFDQLLKYLREQPQLKGEIIPDLPAKTYGSLMSTPDIVKEREKSLQSFLQELVRRPIIRSILSVRQFLLTEEELVFPKQSTLEYVTQPIKYV